MRKQKGYVLLITIVITFFIVSVAITAFTISYRYSASIAKRKDALRDKVKEVSLVVSEESIDYGDYFSSF